MTGPLTEASGHPEFSSPELVDGWWQCLPQPYAGVAVPTAVRLYPMELFMSIEPLPW
jgi:hypothetical protein